MEDSPPSNPNHTHVALPQGLSADSCFPTGNLFNAALTATVPLTLEVEGNSDVGPDPYAKYWLHFRVRALRRDKALKLSLRNANHLKKYIGQFKYRPYMVYREEGEWQPTPFLEVNVQVAHSANRRRRDPGGMFCLLSEPPVR